MICRVCAVGFVSIAMMSLAACGGSAAEGVVVRVGSSSITAAAIDHWTSVMAGGGRGKDPLGQSPREQALSFLISSEWLIGEAAEEAGAISSGEVERRLQARIESYANGQAEFRQSLKLRGQTPADVMLEIKRELASARIRQMLTREEQAITEAQVVAYYDKNKHSFVADEERQVEVTYTASDAAAQTVKWEVQSGKPLASEGEQPESLVYTRNLHEGYESALEKVIFSATPHVLIGPVTVGPNHFVFELEQIVPTRQKTLAQVRNAIVAKLTAEQRQRSLIDFVKAWETKWIARTSCSARFIVRQCKQYQAARTSVPEIPVSLR